MNNILRYKNELILIASILFMLFGYSFKSSQFDKINTIQQKSQSEYRDILEADRLKNIWSNPNVSTRVKSLLHIVPTSKVTWNQKHKKLVVNYHSLTPIELNKVLNKILNISVIIKMISISHSGQNYTLELICKW